MLEPRLAYSLSWLRLPYARAAVREVGGEQVRVHRGHVVPTWLGLGLGLWANPNPNPNPNPHSNHSPNPNPKPDPNPNPRPVSLSTWVVEAAVMRTECRNA